MQFNHLDYIWIQSTLIIHRFSICTFIPNLKIKTYATFMVILRHCRMVENLSHLMWLFPAEVKQGDVLPTCFSTHTVDKCPFHCLLRATFSLHFCAFGWWVHCLKYPPTTVLKCCLVFLSTRKLWSVLWISLVQACALVLWTVSSVTMNAWYILNKLSLNRNRLRTRFILIGWWKSEQRLAGT